MKNNWNNISIRNIVILLAIPLSIVAIFGIGVIYERGKGQDNWIVCPDPQLPEYDVLETWSVDEGNIYIVYFPERHDEVLMKVMGRLWWEEGQKSVIYFFDSKIEVPKIASLLQSSDDIQSIVNYIMKFRNHIIAECLIYPDGSDNFIWYPTEFMG